MTEPTARTTPPEDERPPAAVSTRSRWRRLYLLARPRATRANAFAAALAILLGFAIATQVQQTQQHGLADLREEELVRILDDVTQNNQRLSTEVRSLQDSRDELQSGATSESALKAARERRDTLAVLAGTSAAKGPGIVLRISAPRGEVSSGLILDTVQELRDAGAEAMQVGDVRVVASTSFTDVDGGVAADGKLLPEPYTFTVIGDPQTMSAALDIPGGVSESVRRVGGDTSVQTPTSVTVSALHSVSAPRYAQPVDETPTQGN